MTSSAPSQAELAVLKHLWSAGPQSAREVQTGIGEATGWSYSTTRTLLTRMTEKGLIARKDVHGLSVFEATAEKVSLMGRMIRDFAANVLDMDGPLPGTAFAGSRLFTEEEAEALTRLLEDGEPDGEAQR
ncbi:BlaI/MecI/CopY family transcriptional regulator [Maricaulis sp.]|jgi:predicted transcriptional regulator|uniref:BlaI/MecI/CopY family transcriptional regulator n=1 Tax=Maricaulis sp. TaxID=1486257 RepID=UPI002620F1AE|nr:BlaI/MecI/CopY family transcriptional regulator [Maricaulis sp.]